MEKKLAFQKNSLIKQFLYLNIAFFLFFVFVISPYNWLDEAMSAGLIIWFVSRYIVMRKQNIAHFEFNVLRKDINTLSVFEVNAGTIIGQCLFILIVMFMKNYNFPFWIDILPWILLFPIGSAFQDEYKKNKKILNADK